MSFAALCLGVCVEFCALIWFSAHQPWRREILGPIFSYVAIAGVFGALGVGAALRVAEIVIRRELLRRRLKTPSLLSGYVVVNDPQPTL